MHIITYRCPGCNHTRELKFKSVAVTFDRIVCNNCKHYMFKGDIR